MDIQKEQHETGGRYVTIVDGHESELTYSQLGAHQIIADHTGVPKALSGQGVGKALVEFMVNDARENGFKIVPLCPFVKAMAQRHEEWQDVIKLKS